MPMRIAPKRRQRPAPDIAAQLAAIEQTARDEAAQRQSDATSHLRDLNSITPKDDMQRMLEALPRILALEDRVAELERKQP
jgi:hypothetical protein